MSLKSKKPAKSLGYGDSGRFKRAVWIVGGSVALILVTVFLYRTFYHDRVIAKVGDYEITEKEKVLRDEIGHIFYPNEKKNYGLDQLVTAFTYAQILKNNGHEITDHILMAEDMRINQNSKAPEVLKKIRELFKGDEEAYKKIFVLPTYAERTIYYDFFNQSPKAQAHSLSQVKEIIDEYDNHHRSLSDLAQEKNLIFKKFTLSKDQGMVWEAISQAQKPGPPGDGPKLIDASANGKAPPELQRQIDQQIQGKAIESAKFWIENVLPRIKPGEVLHEPVDHEETWLVVRYVGPVGKKGKFQMEAILVPKDNYQQWLEAETAKVKVQR